MDGDSDIQMVDAPEPSPLPSGALLSGPPANHSASTFASGLDTSRRVNQPASGSLRQPSNSYRPCRGTLGYTPPSQPAKRPLQNYTASMNRGPNFINTPKGSTISFKNSRFRTHPYLLTQNTPRRLSPSEYRRLLGPRRTNPVPNPLEMTASPRNDSRVYYSKIRLDMAAAKLTPEHHAILSTKRFAEESEDPEPKRARLFEIQGAAVPSTPVQSPIRRMPGAFPESPEPFHAPFETEPLPLPAAQTAAAGNITLAGLSIYARIRRITGVVRGAHRALRQGIRTSTQFATAVGQRIRATHEPIPTVVVEERRDTPETYQSDISAVGDQLQAELTKHAEALPPRRYAIPVVDPSAQLQAELVDHTSHISSAPTIVTTPAHPTISANLIAQDSPSVQEEIMSESNATLPEVQSTTTATTVVEDHAGPTIAMQSASTSSEVEAFAEEDLDPEIRSIRELFARIAGDQYVEPSPHRLAFFERLANRPRPVTTPETSPDAETSDSEPAQEREEETQEVSTVSAEEHPAVEFQETTQVKHQGEDQQVEDQKIEEQVVDEHAFVMCPYAPDNDDEYDPNAYYPGVPPLMPERRFFFNAEFRRKAAAADEARRKAAAAQEAIEGPIREFLAAKKDFEAAVEKQQRDHLRSILKRRRGDNPNQRQIQATIQETVSQLAATTVRDEVPAVPEVPRPTRHVHWPDDGGIYFGTVISSCAWFRRHWPPSHLTKGIEPRDRAGYEAYEENRRLEEEKWEREQQEKVVKEREQAFGRVDTPAGESAVRPLTPHWEQRLTVAMSASPRDVLARTADADLTHEKLETCWTRLAWLNDEVINGHLKHTVNYLRQQANNLGPNAAPKYHAFNSFFYKNLRDEGYQKVARWASRVKIGGSALLNVETVFIPVHEGMHWTLLVVSPRMRTIEYFDSLGGNADSFVENTRRWLKAELGAAYNESEWLFLNTPSPQQNNGSDCGVFLLTSAKAIALGLKPTVYGPQNIPLIRKKIVAELMNGGLVGELDPRGTSGTIRL